MVKNPLIRSITKKNYIDGTIYRVDLEPPYNDYCAVINAKGQLDYIFNTGTGQRLAKKVALKNLPYFLVIAFKNAETYVKNSIANVA